MLATAACKQEIMVWCCSGSMGLKTRQVEVSNHSLKCA